MATHHVTDTGFHTLVNWCLFSMLHICTLSTRAIHVYTDLSVDICTMKCLLHGSTSDFVDLVPRRRGGNAGYELAMHVHVHAYAH